MPARETLTYTIHGLDAMNHNVDASVFARKLQELLSGLSTADKTKNGKKSFDYIITDLGIGSARIRLDAVERRRPRLQAQNPIALYKQCAGALERSDFDEALQLGDTVNKIAALCNGAGHSFAHAELVIDDNVIRIDDFLARQAVNAFRHKEEAESTIKQFVGVAVGSFDGTIKEVDLRGSLPTCKLVLSAGGVQLDCITKVLTVDDLRSALDRRAWVEGNAVYGGGTGIPERLEILSIDVIDDVPPSNILRWRGAFQAFDVGQDDIDEG